MSHTCSFYFGFHFEYAFLQFPLHWIENFAAFTFKLKPSTRLPILKFMLFGRLYLRPAFTFQSTFTWFDPLLTAYSSFVHFHCHCYLHLFAFDFHFQNIDECSFQLTSTKRLQSQAQRSQGGLLTQSLSNTGRWFVEVSFCSIFLFLTEKTWLHWKEIHPCPNPHLVYMNIIVFWFHCHLWIPMFLKIYFLQNVSKHIGCPTDDMNKLVTCLKVLIFFTFTFQIQYSFDYKILNPLHYIFGIIWALFQGEKTHQEIVLGHNQFVVSQYFKKSFFPLPSTFPLNKFCGHIQFVVVYLLLRHICLLSATLIMMNSRDYLHSIKSLQ